MKRILLFAFLLLAFALPARAANGTWNNATEDDDWANAGNWTGGVPGNGDVATFDGSEEGRGWPTASRPAAGTIHLVFAGPYEADEEISDVLDGAAIGNVTINHASAWLVCTPAITGNLTVSAVGMIVMNGAIGGDVSINCLSGNLQCKDTIAGGFSSSGTGESVFIYKNIGGACTITATNSYIYIKGSLTITGAVVVGGTSHLEVSDDLTLTTLDTFALDGGRILTGGSNATIDLASILTGSGTIAWNGLTIQGGINATAITHSGTGTLTCDQAGDLDLGGDATGLEVITSAAVDLDGDLNILKLTMGANVTCAAARAAIVGAGGFEMTAGTLTGTLTVDLSAAAGAYTQTDGTIAADAVLNVTTGSGGFTCVACTVTGAVNITAAVNTNLAKWDLLIANAITRLTINSGITVTQSGALEFDRLDSPSATAVLASGAHITKLFPGTATDWGFSGSITGTGLFTIFPMASPIVFSGAINAASRPVHIGATNRAITVGGLACSALTVVSGAAGTNTLIINGNSSGTTVTLGSAADKFGVLTLGPNAVHKWTGAIAAGGGASNALNPQGRCIFTGTFTGTDIVVTPTYEGEIDCFGVGIVTDVTATGRRLVVRRAVDSVTGIPVRSWNGDSGACTNVRFLGPLIIGAPGVN